MLRRGKVHYYCRSHQWIIFWNGRKLAIYLIAFLLVVILIVISYYLFNDKK